MRRFVSLIGLLLTAAVPVCAQPGSVLRNASVGVVKHVSLSAIPANARIVFHTNQVIYTMDAAGGNITQITFNQGRALDHVAVSPDRLRVVASYQVSGIDHLVLFDLVAGTEQELLPHFYAAGSGGVDWDLAGNIYFAGVEALPYPTPVGTDQLIANAAAYDIYRVKYDGTGTLRLTHTLDRGESDVATSADGTLISYMATHLDAVNGDPTELWINTVTGTQPQRVYEESTPFTRSVHDPELSPDNTKLVFSRVNPAFHNFPLGANTAHDLYTIKTDGTALTLITVPGPISIIPDWKGNSIVYLELSDEAVDYLGVSTISDTGTGKARINGDANTPKWIETASVPTVPPPAPPGPTPASLRVQKISWSIDANPANDPAIVTAAAYRANTTGQIAAYAKAREAGVDHLQLVLRWGADIENTLGVYDFSKVDTLVANSGELPLVLNIAPIWDDGNTSLPGGLAFGNFTDAAVVTAYQNMLTALQSHLKGRLYVLIVGNEVDTYLTTASRRAQYGVFLTQVRAWARTLFGVNPFKVTTSLRSGVAATWSEWADIDAATDLNCFTYYVTVPGTLDEFAPQMQSDLGRMVTTGPLMFQEIGLSTTAVGSSEALQAAAVQVLSGLIALVANQPSRTISVVTWSGLEDISATVLTNFGYSSGQLTAGIGLRDTNDAPKAAYSVICGFFGGTNCNAPPPPACTFSLAKASDMFTSAAGAGSVVLTTQTGCAWTLSVIGGIPAWLTIGPASGTGTATITYTLTANSGDVGRSATAVLGGLNFSVSQNGSQPPPPPTACDFTLNKANDTFTTALGSDTLTSTANDATCPWTASVLNSATWLTIDAASGIGNHTFTYSVTQNTGSASRIGYFRIVATASGYSHIVTITQDGTEPPPTDPDPDPLPVCQSQTNSPTGRNPIFSWTGCRQDTWNREYACYLLNPANPPAGLQGTLDCGDGLGGKIFKRIKEQADCSCRDYDIGQFDTWVYQVTGDATYGARAAQKMYTWFFDQAKFPYGVAAHNPECHYPDFYVPPPCNSNQWQPNTAREESIRDFWLLDWLTPVMTPTQVTDIKTRLTEMIEGAVDLGNHNAIYALRIGDSDQTFGVTMGAIMGHLLYPNDARISAIYNAPTRISRNGTTTAGIGGLVPAHPGTDIRTDSPTATAREALAFYGIHAEGGEWIESTNEYNSGTMRLVMEGYEAIKTASGGVDYFPELLKVIKKFGDRNLALFTPDLAVPIQWGDNECGVTNPRVVCIHLDGPTFLLSAGLLDGTSIGRRMQGFVHDMGAKYGYFNFPSLEVASNPGAAMPWVYFNPYQPADEWRVNKSFVARGMGVGVQRSGWGPTDSLYATWYSREPLVTTGPDVFFPSYVDHWTFTMGDVTIYKNHEWALDHPITYANASIFGEGCNCFLQWGFGGMTEYKADNFAASYDDNHMYTVGTTGGSGVYAGDDQPYVQEFTRENLFASGPTDTLIIFDRANVLTSFTPTEKAKYPADIWSFSPSQGLFDSSLSSKMFVMHMPVSPTIAGNVTSWATTGGQAVKMTTVLPTAASHSIFDENNPPVIDAAANTGHCAVWGGCQLWNLGSGLEPSAKKWHIKIFPTTDAQFVPFLHVLQIGTPGVVTSKNDTGTILGAHVTRPGQPDILALFNGRQGPDLSPSPHDFAAHAPILATAHFRSDGTAAPVGWTAVASSTYVYQHDLDPNATWTRNIDAAGAVAVPMCSTTVTDDCLELSGEYHKTVAAAGAHTIAFVGTGGTPPPPTCSVTITLSPSSLPDGSVGTVYSANVTASGGTAPYTYTVFSGTLPTGLSLNSATGAITGTPTVAGTYNFRIKGAQPDGCFGSSATYSVNIAAEITLAIARTGTPESFFDVSGTASSITRTVTMGTGTNRLSLVHLAAPSTPTCTFNGDAYSSITTTTTPGDLHVYSLKLIAPATGAHSLVCSLAGGPGVIAGFFQGYVGVNQTTPIGEIAVPFASSNSNAVHTEVTPLTANAWTVMFNRAWYAPTAGIGSNVVLTSPGIGLGLFDAGPHVTPKTLRTMEATLAGAGPLGAVMFTINPVVP